MIVTGSTGAGKALGNDLKRDPAIFLYFLFSFSWNGIYLPYLAKSFRALFADLLYPFALLPDVMIGPKYKSIDVAY
jgi:hypothetical protein